MNIKTIRSTILVFLLAALVACGTPATPAPSNTTAPPPAAATSAPAATTAPAATKAPTSNINRGGTLRVALGSDLTTMDPHLSTAYVDRIVYQSIYNPLVRLDKDLTLKPELAEKW